MVLFDILYIGQSGLFASQTGVRTTSENVANVNTPGYSRREAVFRTSRYAGRSGLRVGMGVNVETTRRILDSALVGRARDQNSVAVSSENRANVLARANIIFGDLEGGGASAAMDEFFASLDGLAGAPQDNNARTNVIATGERLVETLNTYGREVRLLRQEISTEVTARVAEVNRIGQTITDLNRRIAQDGQASNDLLDQRDQFIGELAELVGIDVNIQGDGVGTGTMTITMEGGHPLISGTTFNAIEAVNTGDFVDIRASAGGISLNLTDDIRRGAIGGLLRARDDDLGATAAEVDQFVFDFVAEFNTRHSAGFGLDGVGGRDFFAAPGGVDDAAENLSLDLALTADTLAAATDPALVPGDNRNALLLAGLRTDPVIGSEEPADALRGVLQLFGDRAFSAQSSASADRAAATQLLELQQSVSGVSVDEEMANLLRFQQSYAAAASIIRTADELTREIISLKR